MLPISQLTINKLISETVFIIKMLNDAGVHFTGPGGAGGAMSELVGPEIRLDYTP